ncbi:hypothetical protein EST38_g3642 [Candolleomyces aberdarensis]|uniref:Hemerythrin-like domain-containing protein n=1 Tax=Candolleomyces aberdarensis TaxID=2316362 RepID=A0A4Q2DQ91_9AGAR|nr:hypothetical protein EST38_g3642 [Candolleomyces aberdarensis]
MPSTGASPRYRLIEIHRPLPADYATNHVANFGIEMSCIHNVFIRALNSLWVNAPLVNPADELGFAGYASTFCEILHFHHHGEEDIIFPFLEKQVSMQENVAQHAAMLAGLDAFAEYMQNVANGSEKYDGLRVKGLIEIFGDVLTDHLHAEIPTLSPENLAKFDYKELSDMVAQHNKHIQDMPGKFTIFPLVATHHPWNEIPEWPADMPGPVKFFIKYITPLRYPSYWKFAPFNGRGQPQPAYSP